MEVSAMLYKCTYCTLCRRNVRMGQGSPFSNGRHFRMSIPKMKTISFFRRKLYKLHDKDTILHMTITFLLKEWQSRANSVPITVSLIDFQLNPVQSTYFSSKFTIF